MGVGPITEGTHQLNRSRYKQVETLTAGRRGLKTNRFPEQRRFIIIEFGMGGLEDETEDDKWSDTSVSSIAHANCRLQPSATQCLRLSSQPLATEVGAGQSAPQDHVLYPPERPPTDIANMISA